ncbi:MAG: cobalamin biosynthesis protein CbiN [Methanoregulaceae archaeon]|nr:MAG: cobalamin biosynthesis protein CbiN [Methanoregulaceae archaeon]
MDNRTFVIAGIAIAIIIGVVAVFFASADPDGLESTVLVVQGQKSLTGDTPPDAEINENGEGKFAYESPMPDYSLGEQLGPLGGVIAIVAGTFLAFGIVLGVSKLLVARKKALQTEANQ